MDNFLKNILKKVNVFSIDISPGSVKILEYEKNKKDSFQLKNISETEMPASTFIAGVIRQPNVVAETLKTLLEAKNPKKIKTRFVVVTMPDDQIYSQIFSLPKVEKNKIKKAIEFQITSLIPMQEKDIYWTFNILSENEDSYEIIVTAVSKESADSFIETLKIVNLTPLLFENRAQSSLRAITLGKDQEEEYLLLDMGKSLTSISINKKDAIQFSTSFYFGLNQISKTIGEYKKLEDEAIQTFLQKNGIDIKDEELKKHIDILFTQLFQELSKAINFYGSDKIKKIYIYGETASIKGVLEKIEKEVKIPVEKAKSNIRLYPIPQWEKHEQISAYIPLIGIELVNKVKKYSYMNLLPQKQKKSSILKYLVQFSFSSLKIILINILFIIGIFIFLIVVNNIEITGIKKQIHIYQSQVNNPKYVGLTQDITNLNTNLLTLKKTYTAQNKWSQVITQIANLVPPGITLNQLQILNAGVGSSVKWQVNLQGFAQNSKELLILENNILGTKDFSNVIMPISNFQNTFNTGFKMTFNYNATN